MTFDIVKIRPHRGAIKNVISVANFVSVLIGQNHSNFANLSVGV